MPRSQPKLRHSSLSPRWASSGSLDTLTSSILTATTASHDRITYCYHFHHIQDLSLTTSLQREKAKAVNIDLSNPQSEGRWPGEEMNTRRCLALYHDALNRTSWHCLYSPSCIEGEVRVVYLLSILISLLESGQRYKRRCRRTYGKRVFTRDIVKLDPDDQYSQARPARVPATVPPIVDIKRLQEP